MYTTFQKSLLYDYMNLQIYLSIFSYWNIRVVLCLQMKQLSKVTLSLPPKGNIFVLFSLIARKHILSLVMLLLPIFCFLQWVFRILQVLLAFFFFFGEVFSCLIVTWKCLLINKIFFWPFFPVTESKLCKGFTIPHTVLQKRPGRETYLPWSVRKIELFKIFKLEWHTLSPNLFLLEQFEKDFLSGS